MGEPSDLLRAADERLALSVLSTREKRKHSPKIRCRACGMTFPAQDVRPDYDEEDRRVGWVCFGCE